MSDNNGASGNIRRDRRGAAMILVLCLMMLFFVLSITTILSSSVLVGRAKEDRIGKQCMVLATSFAKRLDKAMSVLPSAALTLDSKNFQDFLRASIDYDVDLTADVSPPLAGEKWGYYWKKQYPYETSKLPTVPDAVKKENATHRFKADLGSSAEGYELYMEVYWTFKNYEDFWNNMLYHYEKYNGILLSVQVVCQHTDSGKSSRVQNFYQLVVTGDDSEMVPGYEYQWEDFQWKWLKEWTEA